MPPSSSEKGFDGAATEAVAWNPGVAGPTIYARFKSKRGIFLALLDNAQTSCGC